MPIESSVDHGNKRVLSKVTGHITLEEVREYFAKTWTGSEYRDYDEIIDWTGADSVDLSVGQLRSLAGAAHSFYDTDSSSKLAIVISGEQGTRLAKLYRTLREVRGDGGPKIRVFPELSEARDWVSASSGSAG